MNILKVHNIKDSDLEIEDAEMSEVAVCGDTDNGVEIKEKEKNRSLGQTDVCCGLLC